MQRIIDFKERLKAGKVSLTVKRKKNRSKLITTDPIRKIEKLKTTANAKVNVKRLGKPKDPAPVFTQLPGESDKSFMVRVNEMVKTVLKESAFEDKYGVKVQRSSVTGEVEGVVKRPKDELDEMIKEAKQKQKNKKGKKKKNDEPRLTKSQKKQKKLNEKKEKKAMLKSVDFDNYKDTVEFGDIVHEPPTLSAPKKVAKLNQASRVSKYSIQVIYLKPIFNAFFSARRKGSLAEVCIKRKYNQTQGTISNIQQKICFPENFRRW